tara:strand:+ start:1036 stop:1866 length:831 start_codon:yes stop_codon:yes gene_type:complete
MADPIGSPASTTESLSGWAAPYVTGMLGKGEALSNQPYQAYGGPLTAGQSGLQTQAFQGLAGLTVPTAQMGGFNPTSFTSGTTSQDFMSPYINAALEPQIAEAQRQAEIQRVQNAGRLGKAGAFGGSRQAIMESEGQRNLLRNLADIYGTGMQTAYTQGMGQFNTEQDRAQQAQDMTNRFGLTALAAQQLGGGIERDIEQQGVAADYAQFKEERDNPYKQVQFQQSLLEDLPIGAQQMDYIGQSGLSENLGIIGALAEVYNKLNLDFLNPNGTTGP